jgi:ribosomal protein L11 methyltransferase
VSNAQKNNVQDKIVCCLPEQFKATNVQADVVLANILAKPLIDMVGLITGLVVSKGQLVLSGILSEQADSVIDVYQPFLSLNKPVQQEDWVRLAGIKP